MFKWIKSFIRFKQMINPEYAVNAKNRLALLYTFGAWNVFGLVIAMLYKEKIPTVQDSVDHAKILGIKNATVLRMSDFNVTERYKIGLTEKELTEFANVVGTKEELEKYNKENEARVKADQERRRNFLITNS